MGKHFLHNCLIYTFLIGVLVIFLQTHQIYVLGQYAVNSEQKLNDEEIFGDTDQPSEEAFNLDQFKPPDLNWVSSDLRRNEQGDWSNTFPNKESKDLTLENIWKNSESSDDKNILKRSSERKFFKESKSGRKHPDIRKHKEKQKKTHNFQKNKDKFKNLKGSGKKMPKKRKRKDEGIENIGQTETQETKLNDKTVDKQQNYDESESEKLDELDDSTHFYDNVDFVEIDESNIDNSQVPQDEKSSSEKDNKKLESTDTIISSMKKKSKNKGHKNHVNKAQIVSHPDSYRHRNKLGKKHNSKNSLISEVDDNQQDDEALYSDWGLNRRNKVANIYSKKKERNDKKKHFNQENDNENNEPINVKEKELKVLTHWANNVETDFDNTTDISKKGNGAKLTNDAETETKSKDSELKNNKADRPNKEQFDISDYYEDGNVDSNDENNKLNNKIDNASKNEKSSHFLDEVSKFPVFINELNNYDRPYITNKKLEDIKNKDLKDVRKTEMIRYIKNDVLNFQNKLNKDKIMSQRHYNKSSRKHFSENKQFYRRKPKVLGKPLQCENSHKKPLFNHVERVYKLDPIAGDIELQNISQLIKKRSQRSYNHEKNKVLNTRQIDFERILKNEDVLGLDNSAISEEQKVKHINSVHDVFGPKNEIDILYYDEQNRPLLREQRHMDEYSSKDIPEKRKTETFENKFRQGWESLKSKVITKNEKTSKCGESSTETESYSEMTEPVSICSTQVPLDSITKSWENNNSLDSKTNKNSDKNVLDSNKETEQETLNNNDFLTGLLSERIVEEIFNRLQKSSKIIKDLGIGNNVQNVSFEKCIQSENNQELISLEIINKSMANLNSLIQLDTSAQKCYAVPSDIQSFLRYLFNVEYKSLHENYSNFTIADGSFIFNANYDKDMCPGECNCSGECKFDNDSNSSNVSEKSTESLDAAKENKNPIVVNDNVDNFKDKIQFEKLNTHGNEIKNQDDKNINSENEVSSKNIDHDVPKSIEIKKRPSDNIPDDPRLDTFQFTDEYMPETKEINRNKKTLLSVPNHKNLIQNEREQLSDIKYIQRNPYTKYISNKIQERINRKDVDNFNKNAISENMFLNNHRQKMLNNKLSSEGDIPRGINPDVLDFEKVKKRKEKFNHIYYSDTPHFYPSFNEGNDILRNRFDEEENNHVDIINDNENLDEDGFESAHMEIAPMEYYDV